MLFIALLCRFAMTPSSFCGLAGFVRIVCVFGLSFIELGLFSFFKVFIVLFLGFSLVFLLLMV